MLTFLTGLRGRCIVGDRGTLRAALLASTMLAAAPAFAETIDVQAGMADTRADDFSGTDGLTKIGAGDLTLTGLNTYSGATLVSAGQLIATRDAALSAMSDYTIAGGAALNVVLPNAWDIAWIGSLAGAGNVLISKANTALSVGTNNVATIFSGAITGAGSLTMEGPGKLTLTGANNIIEGALTLNAGGNGSGSPTLDINGGSLTVGNPGDQGQNQVSSGLLRVSNGGTLKLVDLMSNLIVISAMEVTGANSTVTNEGYTDVGGGAMQPAVAPAAATLTISGGAVMNSKQGASIEGLGTLATVTVTGPGSTWNVGQHIFIGDWRTGAGTLVVSAGGVVNLDGNLYSDLRRGLPSTTMTVTGAGSQLNVLDGGITLGYDSCVCARSDTMIAAPAAKTIVLTVADGGAVKSEYGISISDTAVLNLGIGGLAGIIDTPDIVNNGRIVADFTDSATLAANIYGPDEWTNPGPGTLTKRGSGMLTLSGTNRYTGGTTIEGGVLSVSSDANLGDPSSGLTLNGGMLRITGTTFNQTDRPITFGAAGGGFDIAEAGNSFTVSQSFTGVGAFTKAGAGTLLLTGAHSYSGVTSLRGGTLVAGVAGAFSPHSAFTLAFGATLALNGFSQNIGSLAGAGTITLGTATLTTGSHNNSTSFSGAITGSGGLIKLGFGTLILNGHSTYAGPTTIEAGKLVVGDDGYAGASLASAVTVNSGASLSGIGAVGGLTVASGATVAPGNSIGTLTVNGNLVLAPGSTYEVEIAGSGASDRIAATGQATVTGSRLAVGALDPQTSYRNGQRYTLISAAGGVNGTVAGAVTQSAFLDLTVEHKPNAVDLVIQVKGSGPGPGPGPSPTPPPVFETAARTRNQFAVAGSLDTLPQAGRPLAFYNSLLMLDAPGARQAFDALSGEVHASVKSALLDESWLLRGAVNDRLRSAFGAAGTQPVATMSYGSGFAVWGQGYGSWGRGDGDHGTAKLSRSSAGLLLGADLPVFDALRFGVVAGYSRGEFDVNGRSSSGESDNYHLGLYGGGQWGAFGLRAGASYTWHDIETRRTVAFSDFHDSLRSDYNAGTAQIFGEVSSRLDLGRVALEPYAGLAYVNLRTDGFGESGGLAALTARGDDTSLGYSTLGLRASTSVTLHGMAVNLRGGLAWRHAFGEVHPKATLAFASTSAFAVAGLPIAREAALVEAGLSLAISPGAALGVSYTGQLAADAQDHAFKANLAVRF